MKQHRRIGTSNGEVHVMRVDPQHGPASSAVVFSHGFTVPGFESRRMFVDAAERLTSEGISSLLFDYRGSGYSDLAFEEMTLYTEFEDLRQVLSTARSEGATRVVVWAMSLGTVVAAKAAREDPTSVDALVFWGSSVDTFQRWTKRYLQDLDEGGGQIYLPAGFKMTKPLLESVRDFDLTTNLQHTSAPLLMVHGTEDDSTCIDLAVQCMDNIRRPLDRLIVQGGNHGFKFQPDKYEEAMHVTLDWVLARSRDDAT